MRRAIGLRAVAALLNGRPSGPVHRVASAAVLVVLLVAPTLAARPAAAQTVHGTLVESPAGAPLPRGGVSLLDSTGVIVDSTRTSASGAFTLRASTPGSYTLYFSHPGYASVTSDPIPLADGQTLEHRFAVPLISGAAIERMSEVINLEERLQTDLSELCGEPPRGWEAGIIVGVVRRAGAQPVAGATVSVELPANAGQDRFRKSTLTSANGVYVICNVPPGEATMRTQLQGYHTDVGPVGIRAGSIGWYDVSLRPR